MLERIYISKFDYIIPFLFMDFGFFITYFFKFEHAIFDSIFNFLLFISVLFIILDFILNFLKYKNKNFLVFQKTRWVNSIVNKLEGNMVKLVVIMVILVFSFLFGYVLKYDVTPIKFISHFCLNFGFIIYISSIVKYGYISVNEDKKRLFNLLFIFLGIFFIIIYLYPMVFADFLVNFTKNLLNIVMTSLTFVLLTATLSLLVFTYNMNFNIPDFLLTGTDYFKATLFAIFISIMLFILFFVLYLFKINWDSVLNIQLFVELNVVCIVLVYLSYLITCYADYFISATTKSIVILNSSSSKEDDSLKE